MLYPEDHEALEQAERSLQGKFSTPVHVGIQDQVGWDSEQHGPLEGGNPVHGRGVGMR